MKVQAAGRKIPMLDLRLQYERMRGDIDRAIERCLGHQNWIFGPEVRELEEKIGAYMNARHCVGSSSGAEALVLALRCQAIKRGREFFDRRDEIITAPFTSTATGGAILRSGATPVFIDIEPLTFNIDTVKLREYLESGPGRAVGIIPVHMYGCPCDMDDIMELAGRFGLFVVEDAAQAFGGAWRGRSLGAIGDAGALSFCPSGNLGGFGDGGMMVTGNAGTAEIARMLIKHGGRDKYNVEHVGYNARLDTVQAAVILSKFGHIGELNEGRRKIAGIYSDAFSAMEELALPVEPPAGRHAYNQYTVRVKGVSPDGRATGLRDGARDDLKQFLSKQGVDTIVRCPVPLHKMKVFYGRCGAPFILSESEQAVKEVLSLPMGPFTPEEDIRRVAGLVREFFAQE